MNNQPRLSAGKPSTTPSGIASERTELLQEATDVLGQLAKTTSDFAHDMHALGVKPAHALLMLTMTLALVLGIAAVQPPR